MVKGISKIRQLFASNADSILQRRTSDANSSGNQAERSAALMSEARSRATGDAIVLSPTIRAQARATSTDADRDLAERVLQLRDQVRQGTYRTDSEKVAVAVFKELL
jgi:anti-sigma28 factor (negative regulator of flagellin synthesis)